MFSIRSLGMAAAVSASVLLAACGGEDENPPPARATIITAQLAGAVTAAEFTAALQSSSQGQGVLAIAGAPICGVDIRYVLYMTRDPAGLPQTASTAALVPNGTDPRCTGGGTGKLPVVVYAHGTTTLKSFNMADIQTNGEASLVAAMFAAQGFIVIAPNYLGYDASSLQFHPYLNAENQALDVVDGMRAAYSHLNAASPNKPGAKLFVTGYSQGGHVAMALQRALDRDYAAEFTVTASGPMSGPYNMGKFVGIINSGPDYCPTVGSSNPNCTVNGGATIFTPLLLTSWQRSYGNLYTSPSQAYQDPFAATAETLFPTDTPVPDLIAAGKLPADPTFTRLFGPGGLIQEPFRADYFSNPNNGFKKAAELNTLLNFKPKGAMALCYSNADPTVFGFNTTDAQTYFGEQQGVLVPALDLRGDLAAISGTLGPAAAQLAGGFQATYPLPNTTGDHGNAAPFCSAFVRGFFASLL